MAMRQSRNRRGRAMLLYLLQTRCLLIPKVSLQLLLSSFILMPNNRKLKSEKVVMKCPICHKETSWKDNPNRPFCSERCKLIDLGKWAGGEYTIDNRHAEHESVEQAPAQEPNIEE